MAGAVAEVMAVGVAVAVTAVAVAAPVVRVVAAVVAVTAVAAVVEAVVAEHQGLSADPFAFASGTLGLNSMALFILNTHTKIQKLRNSHGYRTYSLHHQA